jgi:hypothetical protein
VVFDRHRDRVPGSGRKSVEPLAQAPKPAFDPRLSVNTILREDIFAGFAGHTDPGEPLDTGAVSAGAARIRRTSAPGTGAVRAFGISSGK